LFLRKLARIFQWSNKVDKKLLSILVCPVSKAPLQYDEAKQELICRASGLAYPIREGIPVMLESQARQLDVDEKLRDSKS
jgi:uncharacterized protein YbaR (Trm112 family)